MWPPNARGYNLVALSPAGGVLGNAVFDTMVEGAADDMAAWLTGSSAGAIIAGAVADEASTHLNQAAVDALRSVGVATDLRQVSLEPRLCRYGGRRAGFGAGTAGLLAPATVYIGAPASRARIFGRLQAMGMTAHARRVTCCVKQIGRNRTTRSRWAWRWWAMDIGGRNLARNFHALSSSNLLYVVDNNPQVLAQPQRLFDCAVTDSPPYWPTLRWKRWPLPRRRARTLPSPRRPLRAGKHVLVEKPLTMDVAEARALIDLAATHKLTLMVGHVFKYNPAPCATSTLRLLRASWATSTTCTAGG